MAEVSECAATDHEGSTRLRLHVSKHIVEVTLHIDYVADVAYICNSIWCSLASINYTYIYARGQLDLDREPLAHEE
eukprot:SAG11_NODE_30934_length_296_cov_0.786802_1_plen_76_part_10